MFGLIHYLRDRKNRKALRERLAKLADQEKERLRLERLRPQRGDTLRRRQDDDNTPNC